MYIFYFFIFFVCICSLIFCLLVTIAVAGSKLPFLQALGFLFFLTGESFVGSFGDTLYEKALVCYWYWIKYFTSFLAVHL